MDGPDFGAVFHEMGLEMRLMRLKAVKRSEVRSSDSRWGSGTRFVAAKPEGAGEALLGFWTAAHMISRRWIGWLAGRSGDVWFITTTCSTI